MMICLHVEASNSASVELRLIFSRSHDAAYSHYSELTSFLLTSTLSPEVASAAGPARVWLNCITVHFCIFTSSRSEELKVRARPPQ